MAAQADASGGNQIIITKFTAAGVRRWSSTINTPVPVTAAGQVAGKFQILLDGVGNTYVLSPRAGNPVIAGTTEDLIVRKISDTGATVGYLSLVSHMFNASGQKYNVTNAQMQNGPALAAEVGIAFTTVSLGDGASSAYMLQFLGGVSGGAITTSGSGALEGSIETYGDEYFWRNYSVVGLKPGNPSFYPGGTPKYRLIAKYEYEFNIPSLGISGVENGYLPASLVFDPDASTYDEPWDTAAGLGFQAEGLGSSVDQTLVIDQHPDGSRSISRQVTDTARVAIGGSSSPYSATRVGNDWLVYRWLSVAFGESLLKFPTTGALTATELPISFSTSSPYYAGGSIVSANGRAYLAGGPTVAGMQGTYSSFNSAGELVYSAGQNQPFTLSTSIVVPTVNNRFWTVGTTSTGLQAAILWREPDYFVGISAPSSAFAGNTVTVKAHLNTPAPTGGYTFNVSVSSNLQDAPRTVTVPAGDSSATFTVTVKSTARDGSATVVARTNATHDVNTAHTATFRVR